MQVCSSRFCVCFLGGHRLHFGKEKKKWYNDTVPVEKQSDADIQLSTTDILILVAAIFGVSWIVYGTIKISNIDA